LHFVVLFAGSALISTLATRFLRDQAYRRGWMPAIQRPRDVHSNPMPRLGGVAIAVASACMVSIAMAWHDLSSAGLHRLGWFFAGAALVFLVGLYDDFRGTTPAVKFAVQAAAAVLLYAGGMGVRIVPLLFGYKELAGIAALGFTIVWVLWITNAFNLLDGLDGLSAGSALFSSLVLFVTSLSSGTPIVAVMSIVLAGAILGFLRYNFNPATIFLGDCGSLLIGYSLAALSLVGAQKGTLLVSVCIPIVAFGLPILDTSLSVVRRILSGRPLFRADKAHIHHRLLSRGLSQRQVVLVLYGVSCALGLLSLLLLYPGPGGSTMGVVFLIVGVGIVMGVQHLRYPELMELRRVAQRALDQKRVIVNNLAVRRATEELSRAHSMESVRRILEETFRYNDFDAFELYVETEPGETLHSNGERFFWAKPTPAGERYRGFNPDTWQMSLALIDQEGGQLGTLILHRGYTDQPLKVDINLVIHDFVQVLSHAVQRNLKPAAASAVAVG
jgi:UDP-GlcNAc:undecaprenyl-phosphate GlcNAc-1-phosphate transferase